MQMRDILPHERMCKIMSTETQVIAYDFQNPNKSVVVTYTTDNTCHRCGCALPDQNPKAFFTVNNNQINVYLVFYCPRCRKAFMYEHRALFRSGYDTSINVVGRISSIYPDEKAPTAFVEDIEKISPKFVEIYNQSECAETQGLSEVCGVGYRKAVEFLIKDYLCNEFPDDKDTIAGEPLAASIKRISDKRIQALASRSAWLGNDETHYTRKHEEYNVSDLKNFIHAMVYFLQSELTLREALAIEAIH